MKEGVSCHMYEGGCIYMLHAEGVSCDMYEGGCIYVLHVDICYMLRVTMLHVEPFIDMYEGGCMYMLHVACGCMLHTFVRCDMQSPYGVAAHVTCGINMYIHVTC